MSRPKPTFKVALPKRGSENVPVQPPTTSTFALSGTFADARQRRKAKREEVFDSSQVQSSRLAEWNLNTTADSPPPPPTSTISFGLPTPQTPWTAAVPGFAWPDQEDSMEVDDENGTGTFSEMFPMPATITTPLSYAPTLHSPVSLPSRPEGSHHSNHFAVQALLDLGAAPRVHYSLSNDDDRMNEDIPEGPTRRLHEGDDGPFPFLNSEASASIPWDSVDQTTPAASLLPNQIEVEVNIPRTRKPRVSKHEVALQALSVIHNANMSLWTFLSTILASESTEMQPSRTGLLCNHERLHEFLNFVAEDKHSKAGMEGWIKGNGRKHICKIVSKEMDAAKPMLKMNISEVTPDFIERWDVNSIMGPVAAATPMWTAILHAASEPSEVWRTETVASDTRNRPTTRNIISSSVHYLRSLASCKVQLILGTTAWASGASRRTLDILHQSASSVSYSSIGHVVEALANSSIEAARKLVKSSPHCFAYDNINLSHSIFIEQTPNAPSKVQSGTLPVIYELSANVNPDDMKLEPILARFRAAPPLELSALRPSRKAARYFLKQSMINIIDPLLKFIKGFHYLEGDSLLKHPERRPLPNGHKTKFYCLRVSTHEEASIHGNILLHDNVYRDQLQVDVEGPVLNSTAIPTINDQLTNARIRGAQAVRMKDVSPYEQRIIFQIGFGLFHLIMNLLWGILSVHRGTLHDLGSLSYFFAILEKTRLGEKKPDYHTLLAALTQIVHGLLLNAWRIECGFPSLAEYAASKPSASAVLEKAWTIIKKYATPTCKQDPAEPLAKEPKPKPRRSGAGARRAAAGNADSGDQVFSNTVLLIRDMLYVLELVNASSSGDFGRVEDILPDIACIFHGTGSTNYSNEVLHFLYNIKHVWTPEYANIMRDNMLVNPSGREGHAMPMDLNIEHLIGELKKQYSSKGIYGSWDYLGNISACIDSLQKMKKQVSTSLKAAYQGTRHSDVDVSDLVWRVARNAQDRQLLEQIPVRDGVPRPTTVPDVRLLGRKTFESASLATFNKKLQEFKSGIPMECEPSADDIDPITDSIPEVEL